MSQFSQPQYPQQPYGQPQPQYQAPAPQQPMPFPQPQGYGPLGQPQHPPQQPPSQPPQGFQGGPQFQAPVPQQRSVGPQPVRPGLFSGIEGAKTTVKANYIRPGLYWMRIDECKTFHNRTNQERATVEMTVVKVFENFANRGHRLGESVTQMFKNSGQGANYFLGEIKGFIGNTMAMSPESVTQEHAARVFGPEQPLRGTIVEVNANDITTHRGTPFTVCTFRREVTAQEALAALDAQTIQNFFPNGALQRMAEYEKQRGVQPVMPPQGPTQQPPQQQWQQPPQQQPQFQQPQPQAQPGMQLPPPQGAWVADPTAPGGQRWVAAR